MLLEDALPRLERLAQNALGLWDIPQGAEVRLINVSENTTYLVEAPGDFKAILRAHRPGYHSRRAIECELAWLEALEQEGVIRTPGVFLGTDGAAVQEATTPELPEPRFMVLFEFLEGQAPDETGDRTAGFEELGELAARCHLQVQGWRKPVPFERLTWDAEAVFGARATWGDWRNAPNVDASVTATLEKVEACIRNRLAAFGKGPERYDLIHADMRLANLLVSETGTRVIDFDDCGFGWFLYDFAAAISFLEEDPRVPAWQSAWLRGYGRVRALSEADIVEMDTFIMLRRMALLAWIGSHIEAPEPQALAPHFAAGTARLGAAYLQKISALA